MRQDPVQVDARHYSVEMENDQVRVLRVRYHPGEESVMHYHPNSVAVVVTDGRVRFTFPDGKVREKDVKAGDVHWHPAGEHLPENTGDTSLEVLLIELRAGKT
jgi:quercetin dioxygenase-like cupin family protein